MATQTLSLRIFTELSTTLNTSSEWRKDVATLISQFVQEKGDVDGILPDYKGFAECSKPAHYFQPLYGKALDRTPLVVRLEEKLIGGLKRLSNWQHKLRAYIYSMFGGEGVGIETPGIDEPIDISVSTACLPLTIGETQVYKLWESGKKPLVMTEYRHRKAPLSEDQIKEIKELYDYALPIRSKWDLTKSLTFFEKCLEAQVSSRMSGSVKNEVWTQRNTDITFLYDALLEMGAISEGHVHEYAGRSITVIKGEGVDFRY